MFQNVTVSRRRIRPSKSVEEMAHEFRFGTTGLLAFSHVPLLPESFAGTTENVVFHFELLSQRDFPEPFCKW